MAKKVKKVAKKEVKKEVVVTGIEEEIVPEPIVEPIEEPIEEVIIEDLRTDKEKIMSLIYELKECLVKQGKQGLLSPQEIQSIINGILK